MFATANLRSSFAVMASSEMVQDEGRSPSRLHSKSPVFISIGMMAHNEAERIESALRSLLDQDLLRSSSAIVELQILANGCTDQTVAIAQETLTKIAPCAYFSNLRWSVEVIAQAGKSNAWNAFVHQCSDLAADYLFLMDADIELLGTNTLQSMVDTLERNPQADVAVDRPIKDVVLKNSKTLPEQIFTAIAHLSSERFGKAKEEAPAWICGQLYCGRPSALRQIRLPISSLAEDGLLYQLLVTDSLRSPINPHRVILAKSAAHSFEAYTRLDLLLKHERWRIFSNSVNDLLLTSLRQRGLTGPAVSHYIHHQNQQNPRWLNELVMAQTRRRRWLLPRSMLTRRFVSLADKPLLGAILMLPIAIAAFLVDLWLACLANRDLHRGVALKYWGKPAPASTTRIRTGKSFRRPLAPVTRKG